MVKKKRKQLIRKPVVEQRDAIQVPQADWERQFRQAQFDAGKDPYIPNQDELKHYLNGSVYRIKTDELGKPIGIIMDDTEEIPERLISTVLAEHSKLSDAWNDSVASYQKWAHDANTPATISAGQPISDEENEKRRRQYEAMESHRIGKEGMDWLLERTLPSHYARELATMADLPVRDRDQLGYLADAVALAVDPTAAVEKGAQVAGKVAKTAAKVGKTARASVRDLVQEAKLARKYNDSRRSLTLYSGIPTPTTNIHFSVDDALLKLGGGVPEEDAKAIMDVIGKKSTKEQARFWYEAKRTKLAEGQPQQSIIENTPWFKKIDDEALVHDDGTIFITDKKSPYAKDLYNAMKQNTDVTPESLAQFRDAYGIPQSTTEKIQEKVVQGKQKLQDVIDRTKEKFRRKPKTEEPIVEPVAAETPVTEHTVAPTTETPIIETPITEPAPTEPVVVQTNPYTDTPLDDLRLEAIDTDPTTATGRVLTEELNNRLSQFNIEDLLGLTGESEAELVKKLAKQQIEIKLNDLETIAQWQAEMSRATPQSPAAKLLDEEYKKFLHNKPVSSYYTEDLPAIIAAESPNSQRWKELNERLKQSQTISVDEPIITPTGQRIVIKGETTDNKISSPYNDVFIVNKEGNITGVDTINPANYNRYFNTSDKNKYGMQPFTITNEGRVVPNDPLEGVGLFRAPSQFFTAPRREGGFFKKINQKLLGKPTNQAETQATQFYLDDGYLTSNINVPQVGGGRQFSIPRTIGTLGTIGTPIGLGIKAIIDSRTPEGKIKFDDKLYDLFKGKDGLQYAIDPTKNFNNIGEASSSGEYNYGYLIGQDGNIGSDRVLFHRMPNGKWEFLDQQNTNDLKVQDQNQDLPEDQTPIDSSTLIQSTPIQNQSTTTESKPVQQQESTPVKTQDSWRDEQAFVYPSTNKFFRNEYYI